MKAAPLALAAVVLAAVVDHGLCLKCYNCTSVDGSFCKSSELGSKAKIEVCSMSAPPAAPAADAELRARGSSVSRVKYARSLGGLAYGCGKVTEKGKHVMRMCAVTVEGLNWCNLMTSGKEDMYCTICNTDLCNGSAPAEVAAAAALGAVLVYFGH